MKKCILFGEMKISLTNLSKYLIDHKLLLIVLYSTIYSAKSLQLHKRDKLSYRNLYFYSATNLPLGTLRSHHSRDGEELIRQVGGIIWQHSGPSALYCDAIELVLWHISHGVWEFKDIHYKIHFLIQ